MTHKLAQLLVVIGNWFLNVGSRLSIEAYEENFDGERPFGKKKK